MRTRIFAAILVVATAVLVSNLLFARLVSREFEDFLRGEREDDVFLITAATEGAFTDGAWNAEILKGTVPWALLLGYEIRVTGADGVEKVSTESWLGAVDLWTERRLSGTGALPVRGEGDFLEMPLFLRGERIGTLSVRAGGDPFGRGMREVIFKRRGAQFLWISMGIAAAGTLLFALVLAFSLQGPLRRFVRAAEHVRSGDLSVIIPSGGGRDLERLRMAFNEMVETLARQEERRKRLVTEVAHELRTPLTILRGTVEGMEDGVVPADGSGFAALVGEIKRLERLVGGIEQLARAESGRFFLEKQAEDLGRVVVETVRSFEPLFDEKELSLDVETEHITADVDAVRVRQLLTNLLSNALRHTVEGGVVVRLKRGGGEGGVSAGEAVVEVEDTGSGIRDEEREHIFDRFFRGADSRGAEEGDGTGSGLGLGLPIVKEIAEAHGGRVELTSVPGRGSTFRVILPLRT